MTNVSLKSLSGWASAGSGLMLFAGHFIDLFGEAETGTMAGKSFVLIAHLMLAIAFVGIYEFLQRKGAVDAVVTLAATIGTVLVTAIVFVEMSALSGGNADSVFEATGTSFIYAFGPLLFVVGMVLVGVSAIRFGGSGKLGGQLLIAGTIVFAAAGFAGSAEAYVAVAGSALTGLGFIALSRPLLKKVTA